ncbi:hypothetical protein MRX96_042113 [Rhipicephalus microplus]
MTDTPSKDAPDEITLCASLHATATSRPSSPKQSPAAPMITRARKLKAAANRLQKHSSTSTPTSRPHVRRIGKLLPPRRRQAPKIKAATTKSAKLTAAAEEAAAAISLVPQPSQLHLVPTLQEGSKAELQDYQESVASTPADSEEQASTDSSSPTSSSSWEHNTPPSSSPSLSPSPKGLALFRTGICADGPGRQRATQQASFAAPPKRARAHSAPPATTFCPCLLAVQACRAGRQEDLFGEGCARSAVSPLFPGEGTRMTSTGRATEATLESLAQAGASQTATGNPTLLEPSPPSSGHATRPTRPPERAASPVSDGVVCLPPTSSPQQQHSPPLSRSKESTGASSATAAAPPNSAASTAPHPPSAFGPMRPLTVDASTEADYEEARRKHQQKNGFPCQASTATNAPSSRQPASAAPPSKGKGPRQKPGRRQHQLDIIEHLVTVLELPYENRDVSLVILLPQRLDGLAALEKRVMAARLLHCVARLEERHNMTVHLPRLKLKSVTDLGPVLKDMGLGVLFTDEANLRYLSKAEGAHLSGARHVAVLHANRKGAVDSDNDVSPPPNQSRRCQWDGYSTVGVCQLSHQYYAGRGAVSVVSFLPDSRLFQRHEHQHRPRRAVPLHIALRGRSGPSCC